MILSLDLIVTCFLKCIAIYKVVLSHILKGINKHCVSITIGTMNGQASILDTSPAYSMAKKLPILVKGLLFAFQYLITINGPTLYLTLHKKFINAGIVHICSLHILWHCSVVSVIAGVQSYCSCSLSQYIYPSAIIRMPWGRSQVI